MAMAASKFVESLLKGLKGEKSVQCAYVASDACKGVDYFATPLEFGVGFICCIISELFFHWHICVLNFRSFSVVLLSFINLTAFH